MHFFLLSVLGVYVQLSLDDMLTQRVSVAVFFVSIYQFASLFILLLVIRVNR